MRRNKDAEAYVQKLRAEIERLRGECNECAVTISDLRTENKRLRTRISHLEQFLSQAGDSIELQEAEERGFQRGLAFARK